MKYMNAKKKYTLMNLQLFAGEDGGEDGEESGEDGDDQDDEEDEDGEDPDEKKYSQKDMDSAVKRRLAREKRKWQREQQKKDAEKGGEKGGKKDEEESEDSKARKAAEERASKAEAKNACYEVGVSKDSVDDVVALARSYMAADEDMDLEEAIEKVVKKYPQFKKTADSEEEDEGEKKSWGQRQKGSAKKMSGVERRFYEMNPDLKPKA